DEEGRSAVARPLARLGQPETQPANPVEDLLALVHSADYPRMMVTTPSTEISVEELRLAGRNHSLPLEALRHAITPLGLHYLLIHFDIPAVDQTAWRLQVGGHVERPLTLALDELKAKPSRTLAVTLECAGNGRALLSPRVL